MLINNLKKYDIILASQSPRRQQLLRDLGVDFKVVVKSDIDEIYPDNLNNEQIAIYLAELKAKVYQSEIVDNTIVITADTIVCNNHEVLGKPNNQLDAFDMLSKLSDSQHQVITGVCIKSVSKTISFAASTIVHFIKLDSDEIDYYIKKFKPYDKAGGYGIQEWIGYIGIDRIDGSYFNVMGLPVQRLYCELKKFV